jgi:hypothetical protein
MWPTQSNTALKSMNDGEFPKSGINEMVLDPGVSPGLHDDLYQFGLPIWTKERITTSRDTVVIFFHFSVNES